MKEQMKRQEIAQSTWKCTNPDCGCLLSSLPLEDATWILVGQEKMTDDGGNEHDVERYGRSTSTVLFVAH